MFNKQKDKLGIASDHIGYELKTSLIKYLQEEGWAIEDFGPSSQKRTDYPLYAQKLSKAIQKQKISAALIICGTGIGVSIAANKAKDIRCALCSEEYSARMSRMHNNANMLALGARVIGLDMAISIVNTWLSTPYESGRHEKRLQQINDIQPEI